VTPDGNADTLLRREEDEVTDEPVVSTDDTEVVVDEQRELAADDLLEEGPHPPVLHPSPRVTLVGLTIAVVFRSMVDGVDGIRTNEV